MSSSVPTEQEARALTERALGVSTVAARRFPTGLCHHVYEVALSDGRQVVARLTRAETKPQLAGGVYWQKKLQPLGLPLPDLLHVDLEAAIPHVILSRLPGEDLDAVYLQLSGGQKQLIAATVARAQAQVAHLPEAGGFGHALSYEDPALHCRRHWHEVIGDSLTRSRARILAVGAVNPELVDRVSRRRPQFEPYFSRVRPQPFLDDTTTKNVVVHEGRLSGIVDVDELCFGDPLLTVGLTQMALLARGFDTDYIRHWLAALEADAEGRAVVDFYTAVFCIDFLGEQGQAFNRAAAVIDESKIHSLEKTLQTLLDRF